MKTFLTLWCSGWNIWRTQKIPGSRLRGDANNALSLDCCVYLWRPCGCLFFATARTCLQRIYITMHEPRVADFKMSTLLLGLQKHPKQAVLPTVLYNNHMRVTGWSSFSTCQSQINGMAVSRRASGMKSVPNQACRAIRCGDLLGNTEAAKSNLWLKTFSFDFKSF